MNIDLSKKTFHIWTLGCQMNQADSERIARVFDDLHIKQALSENEADFIVINTCSVRQKAENRVYGKMRDYKQIKKDRPEVKIILTGCMIGKVSRNAKKDNANRIYAKLKRNLPLVDYFLDISNLPLFKEQLKRGLLSEKLLTEFQNETDYLQIHAKTDTPFRAYIPIMTGCNNFCKFCIVPYARGREKSRDRESILQEIDALIAGGAKEIILVGQNVNSYKDNTIPSNTHFKLPFANLLDQVNDIEGDFRIFFTSPHPKDFSDEVINAVKSRDKIMPQIHLPLQAGNNEVLKNMRRPYTKKQFLDLAQKIRKEIPNVSLTTDIVVGFPGETKDQFQETLELCEKARFDMAFVGRFSPREGTEAWNMKDDVSDIEKENREHKINKIVYKNNLTYMNNLMNNQVRVLVDKKKEKANKKTYYGKTDGLKNISFTSDSTLKENLIGKFVAVKVKGTKKWSMNGNFIEIMESIKAHV